MDPELTSEVARPIEVTIDFRAVSKWYGNVIGINNVTLQIGPGVTGLLGPNGAGKSTLLQLATGQLVPSQGEVRVLGQQVWNHPRINQEIGVCPEQDAFYEWMTGWDFVHTCARLSGLGRADARAQTEAALAQVGMTEHMRRRIGGYSKGMRQRTKVAQCLVHGPRVLFLDEPLTGTDPIARRDLMDVIMRLGESGCTVVVSSHVLHEVQNVTPNIVLLNRGKLVAQGHIRQIRDLIDKHPHRIVLAADNFRALAARVAVFDDVEGIEFSPAERRILVETRKPDLFYSRLPELALEKGNLIHEVYSDDDNLEAVFKYLVNR
jgi:ABC-2 type transport system ATP-binding protein